MALPRTLMRLKRIREIEEEQQRLALESSLEQLHLLERALESSCRTETEGRRWAASGIEQDQPEDRIAGFIQAASSHRAAEAIGVRVEACAAETAAARDHLLEKRMKRRQVETLIETAGAIEAMQAERRAQAERDENFGSRMFRESALKEKTGDVPAVAIQGSKDGQPGG